MKKLSIAVLSTLLLLAALTAQAQLPDYLPTEGLVGWWPFNGNANDESGNGNNGLVNGADFGVDRNGVSLASSDVTPNTYLAIQDSEVFNWEATNELTISTWAFVRLINEDGAGLVNKWGWQSDPDDDFSIFIDNQNGIVRCWTVINSSPLSASPNLNLEAQMEYNVWNHIVVVVDANVSAGWIYINGVLADAVTVDGFSSINHSTEPLFVGRASNSDLDVYYEVTDALIDDIAIYNRALTPEEITALYTGEPYVAPCADPTACNFEQEGECVYAEPNLDCDGNCLNDCNNNGVCNEDEVFGCTYTDACNYVAEATDDDGSCTFPENGFDCDGNCLNDDNQNGVCDSEEIYGCTYPDAINYDETATDDDGSCLYTCKGDFDNNGLVDTNDLLSFLAAFGYSCSDAGCDDEAACNYDPEALYSDGSCTYPEEFFNCDGNPINDADGDGIPDELEVAGCTDPAATNYDESATDDDGSCIFGIVGDAHTCGAENVHNPELVYGSVTDIDGNTYRTIVIGQQEWMAENLTVEHYANGDPIPEVTANGQWVDLTTGAWCYYDNDPAYECPYGKLYNWYVTVDDRNVCPTGWHVPTDAEWTILTDYLGGEAVAGGKMKSTGTTYWDAPNAPATNESGFSGLPAGGRVVNNGLFDQIGSRGHWWSSSEHIMGLAWWRLLYNHWGGVERSSGAKKHGVSVRCLKD